jgi:predicted kinase
MAPPIEPPRYLIVGPPAAGKSTTAHALAAAFDRSVHLPVDDLRHQVVGGLALPAPEWTEEIARQVTLGRQAALRVAEVYAGAGYTVVIDDFYDPLGMREYRDLLARPDSHGILLLPTEPETRRRNAARNGGEPEPYIEQAISHSYAILDAIVDRLPGEGWLVLDTTDLDVPGTVRAILEGIATDGAR